MPATSAAPFDRFSWFSDDPRARELSQLTPAEVDRLAALDGIGFHPIATPTPERVVTGNDYFMWPIATLAGDTTIVLFSRDRYHFGRKRDQEARHDENSGIRMITRSSDGGRTWSEPADLFEQVVPQKRTLFGGCGGGLGVHEGVVYLALNEGVYRSTDRGANWTLVTAAPDFSAVPLEPVPVTKGKQFQLTGAPPVNAPLWSPGMRITFDDEHGLILWSTRGFKSEGRDGRVPSHYGKYLVALYSPDFGMTWHYEEQKLPEGIYLNEITPLQLDDGKLMFFLRQGGHDRHFAQAFSPTGWFPFAIEATSVGPVPNMDTPDVIHNPQNGRIEAVAPFRLRDRPMELRLYTIDPDKLATGATDWRFDGVLLRYKDRHGISDGFNPVGGVVDSDAGVHRFHVWAGDCSNRAAIFEYTRPLDTDRLRQSLETMRRETTGAEATEQSR